MRVKHFKGNGDNRMTPAEYLVKPYQNKWSDHFLLNLAMTEVIAYVSLTNEWSLQWFIWFLVMSLISQWCVSLPCYHIQPVTSESLVLLNVSLNRPILCLAMIDTITLTATPVDHSFSLFYTVCLTYIMDHSRPLIHDMCHSDLMSLNWYTRIIKLVWEI